MGEDKEILIMESSGNSSEDTGSISQYELKIFRRDTRSPKTRTLRFRPEIHKIHGSRPSALRQGLSVHGKPLLAAVLTMISSTASFIFFPILLETVTEKDEVMARSSDGYSACFVLTTSTSALFVVVAIFLQLFSNQCRRTTSIFFPDISWINVLKIGVSTALCLLTVCYAWEDHKVLCNTQLPLLGFVFVFASITHTLSRWKDLGFRRSFAILGVISGVFISVDFTLVDNERCRGIHPPPKDRWTWKVHLVWTCAFVVAIWLWAVAIFSMESLIPLPQMNQRRKERDEVGVRMRVLKVISLGGSHSQSPRQINSEPLISDAIYMRVPLRSIFSGLLFLHISTWIVVLSLFWTEFVPGFGKGVHHDDFSLIRLLENGFLISMTSVPFWVLIISEFIFAHSFAYLLISIRSPLIAIGVMSAGFPGVALWWSMFQIRSPSPFLVWMPIVTEIICALLGYPLIIGGTFYLFFLDVLGRTKIPSGSNLNGS